MAYKKTYEKLTQKQYAFINQNAIHAVGVLKNAEYDLIKILQEVDHKKVYAYYGFRSLFQYAVSTLQLSESQAYSYIGVSRKARQCRVMDLALKNKEISVSKLKQVMAHIDPSNEEEWVERVKKMSKRELEKLVAKADPCTRVSEHARYVAENLIKMQLPMTEGRFKKFQRVSEILSQKTNDVLKMQDIIEILCDDYIERNDPVVKAKRILEKKSKKVLKAKAGVVLKSETKEDLKKTVPPKNVFESPRGSQKEEISPREQKKYKKINSPVKSSTSGGSFTSERSFRPVKTLKRVFLPAHLKHEVYLRDHGTCQHHDLDGKPCHERSWLDIHHMQSVSQGGTNQLSNMVLLCRGHHISEHMVV
ncbi:MAG: HNH endonuclease [Bdellovibrionaceae bacterium]|jgi:hypothetical protein|nr:HNH endonuclease [Pseudobdellovibrionaceae bacterium]